MTLFLKILFLPGIIGHKKGFFSTYNIQSFEKVICLINGFYIQIYGKQVV